MKGAKLHVVSTNTARESQNEDPTKHTGPEVTTTTKRTESPKNPESLSQHPANARGDDHDADCIVELGRRLIFISFRFHVALK
jgi:hypothetical protein